MDRLDAMGALVAVVEQRGFAQAARRLGISPSAVTRLVAALEEQLGVTLLARTTRTVALTEAGGRYLARARRILDEVGEADAEARAEQQRPAGRLVVAAPSSFGRREVAPLLCDFLLRQPAVTGQLLLADRVVQLVEEGVDVAVRIGHLDDSSLRVRPLGATRRVLVGSPAYLSRAGTPKRLDDLQRHATIQFTSLSPSPEWTFVARRGRGGRGHTRRIALRPAFVTSSADAAVTFAERGGGLALLLGYQVAASLRKGRLAIVLPRHEPEPVPIQLVHAAGRSVPAAVRAFIDFAVETRRWDFVALG